MMYEMLFSIIGVLIVLLCIMYDKYNREHKRAESWKSDYEACLKNYNYYKDRVESKSVEDLATSVAWSKVKV